MTHIYHQSLRTSTDHNPGKRAKRDFIDLVSMADRIRADYVDSDATKWATSPLNWIRQVPSSHKKGKIGESLVTEWARDNGLEVRPRRHRGHDCVIVGATVEIKLSLQWNSGSFVFKVFVILTLM
jgi:hypothetical protein